MRKEYRELQAVGGLSIQNSSINLMQELKSHQKHITNTLREEIQTGIFETMQAFNLASQNQENVDPNINNIPPHMNHGYNYPSGFNYPITNGYFPHGESVYIR